MSNKVRCKCMLKRTVERREDKPDIFLYMKRIQRAHPTLRVPHSMTSGDRKEIRNEVPRIDNVPLYNQNKATKRQNGPSQRVATSVKIKIQNISQITQKVCISISTQGYILTWTRMVHNSLKYIPDRYQNPASPNILTRVCD